MDNFAPFISLQQAVPRIPNDSFIKPIDWHIRQGEIWTICGSNGSGKSILAEVICGRYLLDKGKIEYHFLKNPDSFGSELFELHKHICLVSFQAAYSLADFRQIYYQQRYNSTETDSIPFVSELFGVNPSSSQWESKIFDTWNLQHLMQKKLVHLSSGELRKVLIAKAVSESPQLLLFDNPFIGLDTQSRKELNDLFIDLGNQGLQLLFLVPSPKDIPLCSTHIFEMDHFEVVSQGKLSDFSGGTTSKRKYQSTEIDWKRIPPTTRSEFKTAVKMDQIEIRYGRDVICSNINWTIKKGEKWALLGPNGSGKSTLLSYIFADNPQAYAKDLTLFDRRRGSGESIWDIKERIGFTSSEMHLYLRQADSCLDIVCSGFYDSIGLFRLCSKDQIDVANFLMETLSISHLSTCSFLRISSGEQRLILFARALVKNPELLILDEPFHGLDSTNKSLCRSIVESYTAQPGKTLIYVTHLRDEIPGGVDKVMELG